MEERPSLDPHLDGAVFRRFYYLKENLMAFCRRERLPVSGSKAELMETGLPPCWTLGTCLPLPRGSAKRPPLC